MKLTFWIRGDYTPSQCIKLVWVRTASTTRELHTCVCCHCDNAAQFRNLGNSISGVPPWPVSVRLSGAQICVRMRRSFFAPYFRHRGCAIPRIEVDGDDPHDWQKDSYLLSIDINGLPCAWLSVGVVNGHLALKMSYCNSPTIDHRRAVARFRAC